MVGLVAAVVVMAAAVLVPGITGWRVHVISFAPLHADWAPRVGPGSVPAVAIAVLGVVFGARLTRTMRWWPLLLVVAATTVAWFTALATVDGLDGIGRILDTGYEYMDTARAVAGQPFAQTLDGFIPRIVSDPGKWPVHIAGHPPGALLFYVVLVRLGATTGLAAGWVTLLVAATTPVAVLLTMRRLGAEGAARRAAPFLALGPVAIWSAVSADAVFGAFAAWAAFVLAVAATSRARFGVAGWGVLAGVLFGACVMMSYGLPLLGVLALAVLLLARSWRPLGWAIGGALAVVLGFALWGFAWWEAYPVLHERYFNGVAHKRPYAYWVWGNLGALGFSAGPMAGAAVATALAATCGAPATRGAVTGRGAAVRSTVKGRGAAVRRAVTGLRRRLDATGATVPVVLTLAGTAMMLLADLSGMSKAEVERIWVPFVPWMLVGTALLSSRWRTVGLAVQVVLALLVQHTLDTGW